MGSGSSVRSQLTALLLVFVAPALVLLGVTWLAVGAGADRRHRAVRNEAVRAIAEPPPPEEPVSSDALAGAMALVRTKWKADGFPGAVLVIGEGRATLLEEGIGKIGWGAKAPSADPDSTLYDLASLSKVVGTTAAVMALVDDGRMRLDDPVQRFLPEFTGAGKDRVRIRHLLAHTSGLPAGRRLRSTPAATLESFIRAPIGPSPGTEVSYSDVGFTVLFAAAERAASEPLPEYLERRVYRPLGMTKTRYLPGPGCERCAPTLRLRSGEPYRGKTSDPTARALGGIAGGAGLFSTGDDLGRFAAMLVSGGALDGVRVFREETVREFTRVRAGETRGLGFERFCPEGVSSDGPERREPCAYGHTGYTGTSLWIDPNDGIWVVLLTNRTYEPRAPNDLQPLRRAIYDRVVGNGSATGPAAASSQ